MQTVSMLQNHSKENTMKNEEQSCLCGSCNNKIGFRSCENKGFQITFNNGWTVSVQFGKGNYCERRSFNDDAWMPETDEIIQSADAECAVWDANGDWMQLNNGDDVIGWQAPDDVAALIARVAAFPAGNDVLDEDETRTDIPVYKG